MFLRGTSPKRHHAKWFARAGTSLNGLSGLDRDQGFLRRFDGMLQEYGARSDKGFDLAGKRLQGFTLALERWQAALTKLVCPGLAGRFKLMGKLLSLCHKGQEAACAIKHIRCRGAKGKQATLSFGLFYFPHVDQSLGNWPTSAASSSPALEGACGNVDQVLPEAPPGFAEGRSLLTGQRRSIL